MDKNSDLIQLKRLADFFFETGMLRYTPRSGFPFLGSGKENVAEHSFRTAIIGYSLAKIKGADIARTVFLCIFHDFHEARTGDFNYVNHRYDTCDAKAALHDACKGTGLENEITAYWNEFENGNSIEAIIAKDADQLDLICNLQTELHKGNRFASEWLKSAVKRLKTEEAANIAQIILDTDPNAWWYEQFDFNWWINRNK